MNNKGSDKNVVTEDVNELKRLLYSDNLTQYGKRKLVSYYDKRIQELEEYIAIAPNLDEMTATKYIAIQEEAYIRGKAEEQQKAEQIIRENYIPKQAVIDKIDELGISDEDINIKHVLQELLGGESK